MKHKAEHLKESPKKPIIKIIAIAVCILLLIGAATVAFIYFIVPEPPQLSDGGIADYSEQIPEETPTPTPEGPTILPELADYYPKYEELAGWITIEGTEIDYPFMYTPDDPNKYVYKAYDESYSVAGSIILDGNCDYDPHNGIESGNLIFHGHNMLDGSMFRTLMSYKTMAFWKEHSIVKLRTLYEEREYEIFAAFSDRVYYNYEDCFKFYKFTDTTDEAAFNEAVAYYKAHDKYDTGITPEFGDRLITLTTCDYHVENGRFVLVAREITENVDKQTADVTNEQA